MLKLIEGENENSEDILKSNAEKLNNELEQDSKQTIKRKEKKLVTNKLLKNQTEQISENEPLSKKLDKSNEKDEEEEEEEEESILEKHGNIHHALIHGNAMKILDYPNDYKKFKKVNFCTDCYLPEETEGVVKKFNYCVDTKALSKNGTGLYFFFFFHKILIFNLIGLFFIAGIPFLYLNKKYTNKLLDYCQKYYKIGNSTSITFPYTNKNLCEELISFTNDKINEYTGESMYIYKEIMKEVLGQKYVDKVLVNYQFVTFICLITLFISNLLFISLSQNQNKEINYGNINVSDYTLLISDLSEDDYEKMIDKNNKKPLEFISEKVDVPPSQINYTYRISEIYNLKKKIKDLKNYQITYKNKETYKTGPFYNRVEHLTKEIPNEIKNMKEKIKLLNENNKYTFTGVIFATFNNVEDLKSFKKNFPSTFIQKIIKSMKNFCLLRCCCCFLSDKRAKQLRSYLNLTVFRPPEPEDIIFQNLEFSFCYRFTKSVVNYLFVILLLGVSFGIVLGFNIIQSKTDEKFENKKLINYGISICISFVTSLINFFIKKAFYNYTENEKMWSHTDKYLSLSVKISIFTFFNSAIVPLLTNYVQFSRESKSHENLVNNVFMIFLCSSLLAPLSSLTCYELLLNKIMRWWYVTRKYKDEYETIEEYTQDELNKLFEQPSMAVSMQYSYLVQQFCMAFFYTPLFPLGIILVIIGVILDYLVEKLKIIYVYKRPEMITEKICFFYLDYFTLSLFCFGLGNYVFFSPTHSKRTYELFNCIFFICILLFPYNYIIRKINFIEKYAFQISYDLAYFSFSFDYERMNPRTQKQGVINYLSKLHDNGYIDEKTFNITKNSLDEINLMELFYFSKALDNQNKSLQKGKYGSFLNNLKRSNMIKKVITKEQEKNKDQKIDKKTEKEKEKIKKDIENYYQLTCYQTNRFFNNIGFFMKNKMTQKEMKKNNNTLLKQKTINNDNSVKEFKITSDDLLNTKANLNFISSGFADNYKNSIKMQILNLNTLMNQKNDFDVNKNFFNNNKNKEGNNQNQFVFNFEIPYELQNQNNNINYNYSSNINIYSSNNNNNNKNNNKNNNNNNNNDNDNNNSNKNDNNNNNDNNYYNNNNINIIYNNDNNNNNYYNFNSNNNNINISYNYNNMNFAVNNNDNNQQTYNYYNNYNSNDYNSNVQNQNINGNNFFAFQQGNMNNQINIDFNNPMIFEFFY